MNACGSCKAPVFFAKDHQTARWRILDRDPVENGNIEIWKIQERQGATLLSRLLTGRELEQSQDEGLKLYIDHHATCPQAEEWRQKKAKEKLRA